MNCEIITKKIYTAPHVEHIKLDNEIALQLESVPPTGPNESRLMSPEYFNIDPFKNDLV
jgi:hypothetical protein